MNMIDFEHTHLVSDSTKAQFSDWAFEILGMSKTARAMIEEAYEDGWALTLSDEPETGFIIDLYEDTIILGLEPYVLHSQSAKMQSWYSGLVMLTRALRDVWQERRHGGFDDMFAPDEILMLSRVRAADIDVVSIMVAWELKNAGENGFWKYILSSDESGMAETFERTMATAPKYNNAKEKRRAMQTCFTAWFSDEARVSSADSKTLEYIDSLVADHNSTNKEGSPFGYDKLKPQMIEILSCLPDKTAYLQGAGHEVLFDPYFAGLDDEYNQAHYMQIMHDLAAVYVSGIPFRSASLASRIFPDGICASDGDE